MKQVLGINKPQQLAKKPPVMSQDVNECIPSAHARPQHFGTSASRNDAATCNIVARRTHGNQPESEPEQQASTFNSNVCKMKCPCHVPGKSFSFPPFPLSHHSYLSYLPEACAALSHLSVKLISHRIYLHCARHHPWYLQNMW